MLRYSIADLVDRLTITLLKHWHLEEEIAKKSEAIKDIGEENASKEQAKELADLFESSVKLNQYRNKVIEAINEFFDDAGQREDRSK